MRRQSSVAPRPGALFTCLALALLACAVCPGTFAAYIQQKPCEDVEATYRTDALSISVHPSFPAMQVNLVVTGLRTVNDTNGPALEAENLIASITMSSLWAQTSQDVRPETTALDRQLVTTAMSSRQRYRFTYTLEHPRPVDDYFLEIRLRQRGDEALLACSNAFITPATGKPLSAAAFLVPATALGLLLIASAASRATNRGEPSRETTIGNIVEKALPIKAADCLAHVQFIFFSGALTLHFPGFVRPITSFSSWSTLMFPGGPITSASLHRGISDGIYEVNGTFGGTVGLELVSQITGAPSTTWTSINIISLACMVLASLMLTFQPGPTTPWTRQIFDSRTIRQIRGTGAASLKSTMYTVSRLFFCFIMTPVAAWTSYQLTRAQFLPVSHTAISAVILLLIPVTFLRGLRQTPAGQLGYFLVDDSGARKEGDTGPREQDQLELATFVLMYLRGCAIGGLQASGLLQLLVLGACETLQLLVTVLLHRMSALKTTTSLMSMVRLLIWLLCIGFLPDVTGHVSRSALGIVLLGFHLAVLVFAVILPSTFRLGLLATRLLCNGPTDK